ncbi:restriction endonuclease subunit S [Parapedobacter soli]|uniref:restriction endonuclease subunit S n=1 Tax=Parapedobacter soli TaxID=416955 RepID=UPI0021C8DC5F|nr:restriction endonuclease subunit S [Parapedobacter soli]
MNKPKNIPELRFPEFVNDGEWEEKELNEACDINPKVSQLPEKFVYIDLESVENGILLQKKIISSEGAPSRAQRLLKDDDVIFQMVRPYQKNNYYFKKDDDVDYVASTGYAQLRSFESSMYLYQFIHTDSFVSNVLKKCTGSNYPAINSYDLSKIPIQIPKPQEQQKIASCLSSLDEVIAAHSQKLDALKDHKKGLMQNLFPQEGETVPKVRFPGFEKDGNWEEEKLGDIAENLDSKRVPITSNQREKGYIPYYGASGIIDYVKDYIFDEKLLCISEDGANLVDRNYPIAFSISGKTWVNNHAHVLRFASYHTQVLVENYINCTNIQDFLTGMAQPKLNRGKLDILPIPLPKNPNEQKKIAGCLSSLDALITAQADKIDQLKLYKKGLMQGLFPKAID